MSVTPITNREREIVKILSKYFHNEIHGDEAVLDIMAALNEVIDSTTGKEWEEKACRLYFDVLSQIKRTRDNTHATIQLQKYEKGSLE